MSDHQSNRIQVVVGIIRSDDTFLISQRRKNAHLGGLWEFPGGKVETGEDLLSALKRELFEEVGIEVSRAEPFARISYDYTEYEVDLHFWHVLEFKGKPHGKEGQRIKWADKDDLKKYEMPPANQTIIKNLLEVKSRI